MSINLKYQVKHPKYIQREQCGRHTRNEIYDRQTTKSPHIVCILCTCGGALYRQYFDVVVCLHNDEHAIRKRTTTRQRARRVV